MSRLIDADEFIKKFRYTKANTEEENTMCATVRKMVKEQPTAFDVDNVVADLEQLKLDGACECCGYCKYLNECWDGDMSEEHTIDMAIEIVKRGGRDENKMSNM